ncbi:MAG: sigma 54-interacting transcriptional regulator [Bacillota bacterium]
MKKIEEIYQTLVSLQKDSPKGVSATAISKELSLGRSNVSRYLNKLFKKDRVKKISGRPVLFLTKNNISKNSDLDFEKLLKESKSLSSAIKQAKAAILYPPDGLHTLLTGETGVGKSMFAKLMYDFAIKENTIKNDAPFIRFNCADYADNPQLLTGQIFGVKKGAYTGADKEKDGLLKKADGGILFLDEVHRLSPQGQEMLFTFIDHNKFRKLGETEKEISANVQLILATTESTDSYLLETFMRRIPMNIYLKALRERPLKERYILIKKFITQESLRVKKSIYIDKNSLTSFLLYECKNNIGQLMSDIKLACAKAFLRYKSSENDYIVISQKDLPYHVKEGLMNIKDNREEIENIFKTSKDVFKFEYGKKNNEKVKDNGKKLYETIEQKMSTLKTTGLKDDEINKILNIDIDSYFRKYIGNLPNDNKLDELNKIVDQKVIDITDKILSVAKKRLDKKYSEKIYFGLALHLNSSIERIKKGKQIYCPNLNNIRIDYEKEFFLAMELAKIIDNTFKIQLPLDEIGYITLFLASDPLKDVKKLKENVNVLVIMHGPSTASSMVSVAKDLVGGKNLYALDMPLSTRAQEMYKIVKNKIKEIKGKAGYIFLVDMGSLTNFGKMIEEELNVRVKTIDNISTPTVIDVARKADLGRSLDEIYKSVNSKRVINFDKSNKEDVIISACFTGKGASERIRKLLKEKLNNKIKIITLDVVDKTEMHSKIKAIKEDYNIKAIVSTVMLNVKDIPYFNAIDIFSKDGISRLKEIFNNQKINIQVYESIKDHIKLPNLKKLIKLIKEIILNTEKKLDIKVVEGVKVGIILHICFLVDNIVNGKESKKLKDITQFKQKYLNEYKILTKLLSKLENEYSIKINEDEKTYILKMLIKNSV